MSLVTLAALSLVGMAGVGAEGPLAALGSGVAQDDVAQEKALIQAVRDGKIETVKKLLDAGVSPNAKGEHYGPLHMAAEKSEVEIAKLLLAKGADVKAKDYLDGTPLHVAAYRGPVEMIELLLKAGADVKATSVRNGPHPLNGAAGAGKTEIVKILIKAGSDLNAGQLPPITEAAKYGHVEVIKVLLAAGAEIEHEIVPPLHWARDLATTKVLLEGGADPRKKTALGQTPLHLTCGPFWGPRKDSFEAMIAAGADPNAKDEKGRTPLHEAAQYGFSGVVEVLLAHGADPNVKDEKGNTPLSLARKIRDADQRQSTLRVLEAAGAGDGMTALAKAARAGDLKTVRTLIRGGAKVNASGPERKTPLHLACEGDHKDVVRELLAAGADPRVETEKGLTPLHLTRSAGIARALLGGGAQVDPQLKTTLPYEGTVRSSLFVAAVKGHVDVARLLLEKRAKKPEALLVWVTFNGRVEVLRMLLDLGWDPDEGYDTGMKPIHIAASGAFADMGCPKHVTPRVRLEMARALVKAGADVTVKVQQGYFFDFTALLGAAERGESEMIRLLLKAGAEVNARGRGQFFQDVTPLHYAVKSGNAEAVKLLLEAGADVTIRTGKGAVDKSKTPLDLARSEAIRKMLKKAGK